MKLKMLAPWNKTYDQPRQHIQKQRHYFANKGPSSQSYGFSSSHVHMWELDHKEGWTLKNWFFWNKSGRERKFHMISLYVELRKTKDKQSSEIQRTVGGCQRQEWVVDKRWRSQKLTNFWWYTALYSFPNFESVCCSMSSSNCCCLACIQVSQETSEVIWYSHLFKNFPQFIVIHTVKGFSVVNEAEVYVFLEFSCFLYEPVNVGNLISGSSAFSKTSLCNWKF